ncbi:MAG: hypothetical protein NVSMB65_03580 [Chloroflexota bacterium]
MPISPGAPPPMPDATAALQQALPAPEWSADQQRFLALFATMETRQLPELTVCRLAGTTLGAWHRAREDPQFVAALDALGVMTGRRRGGPPHATVTLVTAIEEELAKDIWDLRRLKPDYPQHKGPAAFRLDFMTLPAPLRPAVKQYFRLHLTRWRALTFRAELLWLRAALGALPAEADIATLQRHDIEDLLPRLAQLGPQRARCVLVSLRKMLDYMATSPAWSGPRPPRFLVWPDDMPRSAAPLPRPLPPDVLDQVDHLLQEATTAMTNRQQPPLLRAYLWDALRILRYTGMRFEDLAHLRAPDAQGRGGCLEQDPDGYWWIRIEHTHTKMGREHRIPTRQSDGVIDAVRRQQERSKDLPGPAGPFLFRTPRGVLSYRTFASTLEKLGPHLLHEDQPYVIASHQFRHTIATDMIEQGIDIYTVKEFLGHASLAMTERYVQVYLTTLKARYGAYRAGKEQTAAALLLDQVEVPLAEGVEDGGWVEGRAGQLYRSPLPDGIGWCEHLPMLDPCPTVPHCPTCPKLRAARRHLAAWESKASNLQLTVAALGATPQFARARQKHEQELQQAEHVIATIKQEGVWDGRIHNADARARRPVPEERPGEINQEARRRL